MNTHQLNRAKTAYLLLSCHTRALLLGSLLGDGSLKTCSKPSNACFLFRHSFKQKDYFLWKRNLILSDLSFFPHFFDSSFNFLLYRSLCLPSLSYLFHLVTKNNKFCIKRKWLNLMTPLSLAVWWCDDGSLVNHTRNGVFCTEGFSFKDLQTLQQYLLKVWSLKTSIYSQNNFTLDGPPRYRLWILGVSALQKFLLIIIPFIPFSMLYKCLILYKDSDLQQRWISELSTYSHFSFKEIEDLVKKRKSDAFS